MAILTRIHNFRLLLAGLVLLTLIQPLITQHRVLSLAALVVLLHGLYVTVPESLRVRLGRALLAIWALAAGVTVVQISAPAGSRMEFVASAAHGALEAALLVICLSTTVRHILQKRRVTIDLIAAALVGYFLIVSLFTALYSFIMQFDPAAFQFQPWNDGPHVDIRTQLLYFSFVTAASLGYGDILPRNQFAQMLAVVEVVLAQFYLATFVAQLVSLYRGEPASDA